MEYLKFTRSFVNGLILQSSAQLNLDNVLQGYLKNFLVDNFSFATNQEEMNAMKESIEESYKDLLQVSLVEFAEVQRLAGTKTRLHTRDLTQVYGNEKVENSTFEPLNNGIQQELKRSGQNTNWQPDETTETISEELSNNDNFALKDFYNDLKFKVEYFFSKYINVFMGVEL